MSDAVLFTISLGITLLGLVGSWAAYRRRGAASGLRGTAWSLVPMGAYLTGLTEWAVDLSSSPTRWAGVVVAALAAVLYMTSGVMLRRRTDADGAADGPAPVREKKQKKRRDGGGTPGREIEQSTRPPAGADPDMADIEAILRRRGIQ